MTTSVFELFKIGPGPSSSHTIGPMLAALRFQSAAAALPIEALTNAFSLRVSFYGSLSATGRGHGTDRAVLAGLMRQEPETVDPVWLRSLLPETRKYYPITIGPRTISFSRDDILWGPVAHPFPYSNTIDFELLTRHTKTVLGQRYYSTGGGFIRWDGWTSATNTQPEFPYHTMKGLTEQLVAADLSLPDLILRNEAALTGSAPAQIREKLNHILSAMEDEVRRGLATTGSLPGPIGLQRKAPGLLSHASLPASLLADPRLVALNAYALAASEENAAGNRVVTAPTSGACGVLPGIIYWLRHDWNVPTPKLHRGLLAAAAIGFLIKHNASISGAEVGCQGEVGAASAMGAALLAQVQDATPAVVAAAAEIALEHHLGMTCDPVGGYLQIPCIERNAMGAVKAYNSSLMALAGNPLNQKIPLDTVISTMLRTGRDMNTRYKETSLGGLALSQTEC
ncbi:MAG: L-serine ammonia-lyase [Verrucomicrobiota bacterium]|nr:L-serine ammonia-lyase [Verrucomicrobiota bacterium]